MRLCEVPEGIRNLIGDMLTRGFPVWLIGSRANRTATSKSDWDFVIFGDKELLQELALLPQIQNVDVLVIFDGDNFRSPWPKAPNGEIKSGSLSRWKWVTLSETSATYEGTKWPNDWGSQKQAIRVTA